MSCRASITLYNQQMEDLIQTLALYALPVLLAITLHEAAHGYVAKLFGDPTASLAGRVSLNPIRHIDPIGTIAVPIGILAMSSLFGGGFLFGWAKPVPVDFGRLRRPKQDMLWVALAGPGANLFMAILWAISLRLLFDAGERSGFWFDMARVGIQINLVLMALNLLPIPMLDGGHLLYYVVEIIRRKPVSDGVKSVGLYIGLAFVIALMIIALTNDISRLTS